MSDGGIYVMMPVKCIGKMCADCPYLSVETYMNLLYCRGLERCLKIKKLMDDQDSIAIKAEKIAINQMGESNDKCT